MSPADLDDLLGPITDAWQCRYCHNRSPVPSIARDCERDDLQAASEPPTQETNP